ncbi:hypothetical protein D3C86_1873980 [compost metagenome]
MTPPATPVMTPMITAVLSGTLCCKATSVPITVNTARPKASAISSPFSWIGWVKRTQTTVPIAARDAMTI